jgi:nucleotide-binding universal stress UspA family protein
MEELAVNRIVVGVDGSHNSQRALAWASDQARKQGAELLVVHAWTVPAAVYGGSLTPLSTVVHDTRHFAEAARAMVDTMVSSVDLDGVAVDVALVPGSAGEALVAAGREATMIVVGSSDRGSLSDLVLGSTTKYVSRHATVPVVILPPGLDDGVRRAA